LIGPAAMIDPVLHRGPDRRDVVARPPDAIPSLETRYVVAFEAQRDVAVRHILSTALSQHDDARFGVDIYADGLDRLRPLRPIFDPQGMPPMEQIASHVREVPAVPHTTVLRRRDVPLQLDLLCEALEVDGLIGDVYLEDTASHDVLRAPIDLDVAPNVAVRVFRLMGSIPRAYPDMCHLIRGHE